MLGYKKTRTTSAVEMKQKMTKFGKDQNRISNKKWKFYHLFSWEVLITLVFPQYLSGLITTYFVQVTIYSNIASSCLEKELLDRGFG